jgi:hypothetical protein
MKLNGKIFGLVLAGLVLLPSCMRVRKYHPQSLKMVRDKMMYSETQKNITVRAKRLNENDKEYLFNKHIGGLEGNEFQVIYVSIDNMSGVRYELLSDSIDLERVSYADVVKQLKKTSTAGRAVASGLALSYGVAAGVRLGTEAMAPGCGILMIPFIPMMSIGTAVAAVTGIRAIESWRMNRRIDKDLKEKMLAENMIIMPYGHHEGLIFVKSIDYNPQFSITVREKNNRHNKIIFDVDLLQTSHTYEV